MNMFKRLAQRFVNHFGYEIRRIGSGSSRRTMADVLVNVARLGFVPNVVIDVGVAKGTPALYNTFPDSYHLLIEPLDVVAYMKNLGFVVYDIFGEDYRPLDGALGQIDIAFVKENGIFRTDHAYATAEQWQNVKESF